MSRLGEELARITTAIDGTPSGTSDVGLEIKRIIKALDSEASTDGGVLENVIKIRELVEDGAGQSSSTALIPVTIVNESAYTFRFTAMLDENGACTSVTVAAHDETDGTASAYIPMVSESYGYVVEVIEPDRGGTIPSSSLTITGSENADVDASGTNVFIKATSAFDPEEPAMTLTIAPESVPDQQS